MITKEQAMENFKQFCLKYGDEIDPDGEEDWHSLSIGFFGGCGIVGEDAQDLARIARYEYGYWTDDWSN